MLVSCTRQSVVIIIRSANYDLNFDPGRSLADHLALFFSSLHQTFKHLIPLPGELLKFTLELFKLRSGSLYVRR